MKFIIRFGIINLPLFFVFKRANLILIPIIILLLHNCSRNTKDIPKISFLNEITNDVNLDFFHNPATDGSYYMPESMGSGGAFLDYDNDGDLDIYLINCSDHTNKDTSNPLLKNQLYRQEDNGKFVNVTEISGLGDTGYGMGVAVGDYNNDGYVDVYISNVGPDVLYRNNGDGTFTNVTEMAGIENPDWGISTIFLDYNLDNHLDIFVTNYVKFDTSVVCTDRVGSRDYCGPQAFQAYADRLFKNNGDGTFTNVSKESGIGEKKSAGLGTISADFNNDAYPDIYVGNDREQNHLWINQKDGTFIDHAMMLGVGYNGSGMAEASMGVAVGDIENDGDLDLFMAHFRGETNTLYRNLGEMGFSDDTAPADLGRASIQYTGFGSGFFDYDNDGDLDLAVVNGSVIRGQFSDKGSNSTYWDHYSEPNLIFKNDGSGHFNNQSDLFSSFSEKLENSRGLVFGDIDNDGDIDLLVTNEGGKARLYRNDYDKKGNWIIVRAIDSKLNRDVLGAKIKLTIHDQTRLRLVNPGYSYCSSNDPRVHFGLGTYTGKLNFSIEWPDGINEEFLVSSVNQIVTLKKGTGIHIPKI